MPLDWTPFVDLVHRHQRFLLTTHVRPDGDGLGSMLALTDALTALGKQVELTVGSVIPPRYNFLDPQGLVKRFNPASAALRQAEAAIAMDTGWFRHNNTTPATFVLAAELVRHGANPTELYELLFEQNTLARLKLTSLVMGRIQVTPDGLVSHSELRRDDYAATGATP